MVHDATLRRVAPQQPKDPALFFQRPGRDRVCRGGCVPLLRQVTAAIHAPALLNVEMATRMRSRRSAISLDERGIEGALHRVFVPYPRFRPFRDGVSGDAHDPVSAPVAVSASVLRRSSVGPAGFAVGGGPPFSWRPKSGWPSFVVSVFASPYGDQKGSRLESGKSPSSKPDIAIVRRTEDVL